MYNKINNLFLIAGHHNNDPGAVSSHTFKAGGITFKEADIVREIRDLLAVELESRLFAHAVIKDNDSHNLSTVLGMLRNGTGETDLVIDIHLNAHNTPGATGAECFIKDVSSPLEKTLASDLCNTIAKVLNVPNRGVKTQTQSNRGRLGIMNIPAMVVLVEAGFISNPGDVGSLIKNKHILVSALADTIQDAVR